MCSVETKPLFRDLSGDDPDPEVTQIESLCMNCQANGTTRLLLTRIPHYKSVVLMSFSCEECGFENNEVQLGNAIPEKGIRYRLHVTCRQDLDRQLVKSEYTSVRIPELEFEIPAQSQQGEITTVEGVISRARAGLQLNQPARREAEPEAAAKIDVLCDRMERMVRLEETFHVELDDISGNCFVENPEAPKRDPRCTKEEYKRTAAQDRELSIFPREEVSGDPTLLRPADAAEHSYERLVNDEVMTLDTDCPDCGAPAATNCKLTDIPHFKQVLIMATTCDSCGHRSNEVKSGGGIEEKGVRFELRVASREDFSRDVLKSETCCMSIPELQLEVGGRALGGRFSTAEGLLRAARDQLADAPGVCGDSASVSTQRMNEFLEGFDAVLAGKRPVTLVLDDPAGNSYVQSLSDDPDTPDPGLKIELYERSFEQNDELGLNDMKTEGYELANGSVHPSDS